jgi:hypothetical protein
MSWDDLDEKNYEWPTLKETQTYRDRVYDLVSELIDRLPLELPITEDSPWWVIMMGVEHENIHLETSSVLIRQLPFEHVKEDVNWKECSHYTAAPQNELLKVSSGTVILGKKKDAKLFGWDNEYGDHQKTADTVMMPFGVKRGENGETILIQNILCSGRRKKRDIRFVQSIVR